MGELVGLRGPRVLAPRKGPSHRRELRWPLWGRHEPHGAPEVLTPREGAVRQASRSLSLAGVLPACPASWKPAGPAPAPELGPRRGDPRPACAGAPPRRRGGSTPVNPLPAPTARRLPLTAQQCGRRPGRPSPRDTLVPMAPAAARPSRPAGWTLSSCACVFHSPDVRPSEP